MFLAKGGRMLPSTKLATLPALAAAAVLAIAPAAAQATSSGQGVTGTSLGPLAILASPPTTFTVGFQAGSTASTTGLLTLTDTDPSWHLSVQDEETADPGHMTAAAIGCDGSEASLQNPLSVSVASPLGGVSSSGPVGISGSPQT